MGGASGASSSSGRINQEGLPRGTCCSVTLSEAKSLSQLMLRCFAPLSMTFRRFMLPLPKDTIYFHILTVITGLVFALGVAANVSVWLRGRVEGAREESAGARLGAFV